MWAWKLHAAFWQVHWECVVYSPVISIFRSISLRQNVWVRRNLSTLNTRPIWSKSIVHYKKRRIAGIPQNGRSNLSMALQPHNPCPAHPTHIPSPYHTLRDKVATTIETIKWVSMIKQQSMLLCASHFSISSSNSHTFSSPRAECQTTFDISCY